MTPAEAEACVKRAQAGDEKAVVELFHYMHPHVAKLVHANLPPKESAEDLIQQVCIKAVTSLHQFSGRAPFLHWISRITVNTCLNRIRHEKNRPELRLSDLSEDQARVVEQLATSQSELEVGDRLGAKELVEQLLGGLKGPDRLLMRLLYLEEHSIEEVAGLTGWSRAVIKIRAFRARALLRKRYAMLTKENR
jgi:RNA polymerase sigma-70 factor (ECF subfamily)